MRQFDEPDLIKSKIVLDQLTMTSIMDGFQKAFLSFTTSFLAVIKIAPLSGPFLVIYLCLPSTIIIPPESVQYNEFWHPAYITFNDGLLILFMAADCLLGKLKLPNGFVVFFFTGLMAFFFSWIINEEDISLRLALDMLTHWIRFLAAFTILFSIKIRCSNSSVELYWILISFGLCISSLFVAALQYEGLHRIWAAGMTVASFSQFLAATVLIMMVRKRLFMVFIFSIFLLLTVSRTSIISLLVAVSIFNLLDGREGMKIFLQGLLLIATIALSSYYIYIYDFSTVFASVIDSAFEPESVSTLNSRTIIWAYAQDLLLNKDVVPWSGIGLFGTPKLLSQLISGEDTYPVAHFHNFFLEFIIGGGVFSLPLILLPLYRAFISFLYGVRLAGCIYILFLITQTIDFTLYGTKSILAWGIIFGYAESMIYLRLKTKNLMGRSYA
jgi:hypothetical protein